MATWAVDAASDKHQVGGASFTLTEPVGSVAGNLMYVVAIAFCETDSFASSYSLGGPLALFLSNYYSGGVSTFNFASSGENAMLGEGYVATAAGAGTDYTFGFSGPDTPPSWEWIGGIAVFNQAGTDNPWDGLLGTGSGNPQNDPVLAGYDTGGPIFTADGTDYLQFLCAGFASRDVATPWANTPIMTIDGTEVWSQIHTTPDISFHGAWRSVPTGSTPGNFQMTLTVPGSVDTGYGRGLENLSHYATPSVVTPEDTPGGGNTYVRRRTTVRALPYELTTGDLRGIPWQDVYQDPNRAR